MLETGADWEAEAEALSEDAAAWEEAAWEEAAWEEEAAEEPGAEEEGATEEEAPEEAAAEDLASEDLASEDLGAAEDLAEPEASVVVASAPSSGAILLEYHGNSVAKEEMEASSDESTKVV